MIFQSTPFFTACPEEIERIDEMMLEYEGREEALIGHLSIMLAAKNQDASNTEDEDRRLLSLSNYIFSTLGNSTYLALSMWGTENSLQENKHKSATNHILCIIQNQIILSKSDNRWLDASASDNNNEVEN